MEVTKENLEASLQGHFALLIVNRRRLSEEEIYGKLIIIDAICRDFGLKDLSDRIREHMHKNCND